MSRRFLVVPLAAALIGLAPRPGAAQQPPWQKACIAIQPAVPCAAEYRVAIEDAIQHCRNTTDQPACQREYLKRQQEPAGPPTIFRGGRN